jgi:hypothetical protein
MRNHTRGLFQPARLVRFFTAIDTAARKAPVSTDPHSATSKR